ncbi:MAG: hypothetical protein K0S23_3260 [Fluviicola sp.]|uniref:hypothetical protein n=1 Tax=Fluviicola sp. TaxID=1917219 RepID=UPI002623EAEF|nr:hypothetical protein [Fluviicola sp.]MDF3028953.1 hypothetical protein [Fluviicola sp.]
MKTLIGIIIGLLLLGGVVSCGAEEEKVKVDVEEKTPEYKAYDLVQNLQIVKDFKANAEAKNQSISLKLSKERLNGKNGFYWFQVILHVGNSSIVKMNIKVREDSFKVALMDEDTGMDLSPEEYQKKFPIK